MSLPAIGSPAPPGPAGRPGIVVGARPVGEPRDGRQLVAVTIKHSAPRASGVQEVRDLDPAQRAALDDLRRRDQQVRQEERAHAAVAGDLAGPISYVTQRGPDGRLYAIGGSVPIEARVATGDPAEARRLGARVAAAAQAATNPSGADLTAARRGYGLLGQAERSASERSAAERGGALDLAV